jgi:hypothetical protein
MYLFITFSAAIIATAGYIGVQFGSNIQKEFPDAKHRYEQEIPDKQGLVKRPELVNSGFGYKPYSEYSGKVA